MDKNEKPQGMIVKFLSCRYGLAIFYALVSAFLSVLIGMIMSLVTGHFPEKLWYSTEFMFLAFFAGTAVAAVLLLITKIPTDLTFGFGNGLYYGALGSALLIGKLWEIPSEAAYIIGFIIAALVCYIVWIKKFKP